MPAQLTITALAGVPLIKPGDDLAAIALAAYAASGLAPEDGLPTGLQVITISLAEIAVLSFVNRFGSHATAAYGAVNQVVGYVQFPAMSIGIAGSVKSSNSCKRSVGPPVETPSTMSSRIPSCRSAPATQRFSTQ